MPAIEDPDSDPDDIFTEFYLSKEEKKWVVVDDLQWDILLKPTTQTKLGYHYI